MAGQPLTEPCDVLGLGIVAMDDILGVAEYPGPESKVYVRRRDRQGGGLTGTALVAAARLGARCVYAGGLGVDEASAFLRRSLEAEGIILREPGPRQEVRPYRATIVVDESAHTRAILVEKGVGLGDDEPWPPAEMVQSARVLFVDHQDPGRMIRAARIAKSTGIPVVSDVEVEESPRTRELLGLADHLLVGEDFACRFTGEADPATAASALWAEGRAVVAVTCGESGSWFTDGPSSPPRHQPAFRVNVVDTTGCGDVFHGAYAAELARGAGLADRLRFASAAAALKATRPGGQGGCPSRAAVESFLREHDS